TNATGYPTRFLATHEHRPHCRPRDRADLHSICELGTGNGNSCCCHRLRIVRCSGWRLWHRGLIADGSHDLNGDFRCTALEAQPGHCLWRKRESTSYRSALLRVDLDKIPRRPFVSLASGPCVRVSDAHLAQGRGNHGQRTSGGTAALQGCHRADQGRATISHPRHAVVLGRMTKGVPLALTHNLKLNHVLHERALLVAV